MLNVNFEAMEEQLKKRLGVPENWDKHDYEHGRYSFNDLLEIAEEVVKANSVLGDVSYCECEDSHKVTMTTRECIACKKLVNE